MLLYDVYYTVVLQGILFSSMSRFTTASTLNVCIIFGLIYVHYFHTICLYVYIKKKNQKLKIKIKPRLKGGMMNCLPNDCMRFSPIFKIASEVKPPLNTLWPAISGCWPVIITLEYLV